MIIRSMAARQGCRALFAPSSILLRQACCQRAVSTEAAASAPHATTTSSSPSSADGRPWGVRRDGGSGGSDGGDVLVQNFLARTKLRRKTAKLGSSVERRYVPGDLLRSPPYPKDVTLEMLLAAQTHLGHHTSLWNPANARYIHGIRSDVHVIALEQTAAHLRRAARVVEEVAYRGGLLLFVGTRKGQMEYVVRAAELAGGCHLFTKWTAGTISNRDQILRGGGGSSSSSSSPSPSRRLRIVDELDRDRTADGFAEHVADCRPLLPDLVVVLNPMENFVLLRECAGAAVPTIGVIDTDADPGRVTYAIPANDDSLRSVGTIAGVLGRAGELGQKRRLRDAQQGIVAWQTPTEVARYMAQRNAAALRDDLPQDGEASSSSPVRKNWILSGGKLY